MSVCRQARRLQRIPARVVRCRPVLLPHRRRELRFWLLSGDREEFSSSDDMVNASDARRTQAAYYAPPRGERRRRPSGRCFQNWLGRGDRTRQHGCKHRLKITGRAVDYSEHLGRSNLLSLALRVALLVEQSRIFDRDHRLVAEGLRPVQFQRPRKYRVVFPPA